MRVIQLLPTISFGDAISNEAIAIKKLLAEQGYKTGIYAESIDKRLPKGTALSVNKIPRLKGDDVVIYHCSTGTPLNYSLPELGGKAVMIYHNITPPEFFSQYSVTGELLSQKGMDGLRFLSDKVKYCIADSEYNKECLQEMGYSCPIDVCPILISIDDYKKEPDPAVIRKYENDGYTNLLFVGRIAPNKKQEDVIAAFYYYKKHYNEKSRLFLVGSRNGMETYHERLETYINKLGISDCVIFPGHISFKEILAYYTLADVFLCMSEHEGFCVPLVEAMQFRVPIIAYRSSAIPETLGDAGILLDEKDPAMAAAVIDRIATDEKLRLYLKERQTNRLKDFSREKVKTILMQCIDRAIRGI